MGGHVAESVFHRLHRIRKLEEQTARMDKIDAAVAREERDAEVREIEVGAERSRQLFTESTAGALYHHHTFAVHNEMQRRSAMVNLWGATDVLQQADAALKKRAVASKVVELLAEAHEEREAIELRAAEQGEFDELGTQRWLRHAS